MEEGFGSLPGAPFRGFDPGAKASSELVGWTLNR